MNIFLAIILMALVTYGSRLLPFLVLRGRKIDGFLKDFIELVPVALLAALVIPDLFMPSGSEFSFVNPFLWAGVLTFAFSKYVPNLFLCVSFGMLAYWGLDKFL